LTQGAYRAKVGQLLRQQDPGLMQAPLHRFLKIPDHRGRLGMSQPLDAEQVESLPLVLREALDRPQNAAAVWAEARIAAAGRGGGLSWLLCRDRGLFI
jgi:hypothetical protein